MVSGMPSFGSSLGGPPLVVLVSSLILFGVVWADSPTNLVRNGNFEELKGYFPAGVMVRRGRMGRHFIPHWMVSERGAPVEVISSLFWQSSLSSDESLYAVHLNTRAGPGSIQTKFPSPRTTTTSPASARYQLSVDVAGNPNGGSAVKLMEVVVSPSECRSRKLSVTLARDANSKRLSWKTEHMILNVDGSEPTVRLQFRSLTPGAYGPLIDNVRLVPLPGGDAVGSDLCNGNVDEEMDERPVKSLTTQLVERVWMPAETWIRQRFLRREDW